MAQLLDVLPHVHPKRRPDQLIPNKHTPITLPLRSDQGYGRRGTPIFTGVFEPLARVALYPADEDGLGTWFGAA